MAPAGTERACATVAWTPARPERLGNRVLRWYKAGPDFILHLMIVARAFVLVLFLASASPSWAAGQPDPAVLKLGSANALVYDPATGRELYRKGADDVTPIASVTKLMTAMVVLDANQPLDETLDVDLGDLDYLKDVYPFHPALIEMLVDVTSLMQRERSALRLLYELLGGSARRLPRNTMR